MAGLDDLSVLLGHVDGWFEVLNPPIDQFDLELDNNNRTDKKRDHTKLKLITRTTDNWFKSLSNPPINNFNINIDVDNIVETVDINSEDDEECHLDELAKNLELLLDDCEQASETVDIYYFPFYSNFEHSILDPGVGHCCTINELSPPPALNLVTNNGFDYESIKSYELSLTHSQLHNSSSSNNDSSNNDGSIRENNQQSTNCDLIKREHQSDQQQIQSPMPLDHEYLPRPKQKPLLLCNRISSTGLDKYLMATCKRQKLASALNTGAIKRFARFSDKLRLLTCD